MTSDKVISARVPADLKKRIAECVKKYAYTNEGDFIREAVRMHITGLERKGKEV